MGKTSKNIVVRSKGTRKRKDKDLEDYMLKEETLSDTDTNTDTDTDTEDEYYKRDDSISKEINKMMNNTIENIKDGDMTLPAIGIGMIAIIGFALYKGVKI
jgi:hypothetical protein